MQDTRIAWTKTKYEEFGGRPPVGGRPGARAPLAPLKSGPGTKRWSHYRPSLATISGREQSRYWYSHIGRCYMSIGLYLVFTNAFWIIGLHNERVCVCVCACVCAACWKFTCSCVVWPYFWTSRNFVPASSMTIFSAASATPVTSSLYWHPTRSTAA